MKKRLLLFVGFVILNLNGFSQAYSYYPYGGSGNAYSVPDATCDQLYEIEDYKTKGYNSGSHTTIPGREIIFFDKVNSGAATYATDYNSTCGASPAGTAAIYTNFRTDWVSASMDPKVGKWNAVPDCLEGTVGAYFYHTVNFTQTGDYKFLFRIRGNSTTGTATNSTVVVAIYDKTNMATPLSTKTIKIDGLKYNTAASGTYTTGTIGNTSTDGSAEYAADGNFATAAAQSAPEWVRGTSAVTISTAGEYVVKISHAVGAATQGIGGFTFQKVATSPTLYTTGSVTGITTVEGNASSSKLINIAGAALTGFPGTLTITGSTNFEVSSDNISFGSTASVNYASATLSSANIYVRLKAAAAAGSYTENVTISGGGASAVTVSANGDVTTSPTIILTGLLTPFPNTINGDISAEKTYTLSGSFLTNDITVTAPAGFKVSKTSGSGFASSVVYTQSGGTVSTQTVYVRFEPSAVQAYSGNITHTSSGATQKDQAVSGTGISAAPSVSVVSPLTNTTAVIGGSIVLTATAVPTGSRTISSVVFKDGTDVIPGTVSQSGNDFSITYTNFPSGSRSITAVATDNQSNVTTSSAITVRGVTAYTGNKYAQSAITWANGPWYDAASGGNEVTVPISGDNVFTQGNAITISDDATCDNVTFTNAVGQFGIAAGKTLIVRGKVDCTTTGSVDAFSTMNATATLKLTGEALSTTPYTLITDAAATGMKPHNVVIEPVNIANTYVIGVNGGSGVNYVHGSGKFTVKANAKLDNKVVLQLGSAVGNELIIEDGAYVTSSQHFKASASNNTRITKITINGSVVCGDASQLIATTLVLGNSATLKTLNSAQTNATVLTWDGWWGAKGLSTPAVVADFGTPATITMGTNTTIEFGKSGDQNINGIVPANGSNPTTQYSIPYVNLKVSGSGNKTIQSDLTVTGTLDIANGTTLTIASGKTLTLAATAIMNVAAGGKITNNGTIVNSGAINFLSNANDGTATITGDGTITGAGTTSVKQFLTTGRNWYIANPMTTAVSPTVASGTITLNGYDETIVTNGAGTWGVTTNPLTVGKGYVASVSADGNIIFTGSLNNGSVNIPLTSRTGTIDKAGFNLIANPYPSYLDWSLVAPESSSNLAKLRSNVLWYRTKVGNNPYSFWTVNGDGIGVPNGASVKIPPMQAFWVRAVEGVSEPIVLTNAMRSHAPATDKLLKAPASKNAERTLVRLQVSNGVNTDEAVIYFNENAQNGLDMLDAPKMSNGNVEIPEIYTTLGAEKIVINSMKDMQMDTPIGLGFVAGNAASFSLKANELTNLPEGVKLILRDNVTLAETDLTNGTAVYQFVPASTGTDRFSVIFRSVGTATGLTATEKPKAQVYMNGNNEIVIIVAEKAPYKIYNAVGQLIDNGKTSTKLQTVNRKLEAGVYVVKVNDQSIRVIVK